MGPGTGEKGNHNMEQLRTQLMNLTPYERTRILQELLDAYPSQSRIYCCAGCNALVGEDFGGKGKEPITFYPCDKCEKIFCKDCDRDIFYSSEICEACRE